MDRVHVAVLMGGVSSEHEVSLRSGAKVVAALDPARYVVMPVTISKAGRWVCSGNELRAGEGLTYLQEHGVDCVFLALHGPFDEDGRIQGALDLVGIPYIGCGHTASAIAMDKVRTKALAAQAGVPVASQLVVAHKEWRNDRQGMVRRVVETLGLPCVVKDPCEGSSLHMAIPSDETGLTDAVGEIFQHTSWLMIEQYLKGRELTCGVLDVDPEGEPIALPVTEIRPVTASFFDYVAKYTPGATEEITPAPISEEATRKAQAIAVRAHSALGCRGLSRSDMILVGESPIFIEINTIPGMTETSLYPQAAAVYGLSFPDVVHKLIDCALADAKRS